MSEQTQLFRANQACGSLPQAEEVDFTMQVAIAAVFTEKLLTSFRQGKNRQKNAINLLFS